MSVRPVDFGGGGLVFVPTSGPSGTMAESDRRFVDGADSRRWLMASRAMRRDLSPKGVTERLLGVDVVFDGDDDRRQAVIVADTEWRIVLDTARVTEQELRVVIGLIPVLAQRERFAATDQRPITQSVSAGILATWLE